MGIEAARGPAWHGEIQALHTATVDHPGRRLSVAFVAATAILVTLCLLFDPIWETNDDIHLSMMAHGYGIMAQGSPYLIYSNILWGYMVRGTPEVLGFTGYTVATLGTLIFIGTGLLYTVTRLGLGYPLGVAVTLLLAIRLTVFPQYTMNAGLLALVAILGWQAYARRNDFLALLLACGAAFLGYLLRSQEFCLVLMVALPLLPWNALRNRRPLQIDLLAIGLAIAVAAVIDYRAYQTPEWQGFREFAAVVRPFVDYGGASYISGRPDILAHYGFSTNDIRLFGDWFFVDQKITDVKALNGMLREFGPFYLQPDSLSHGWQGIAALSDRRLLIPTLTALLLAALKPSREVALTWVLFLAAIFALGSMGRPGVLRVYIPVLSVLIVAPLLFGRANPLRLRLVAIVLALAVAGQLIKIGSEYRWRKHWTEVIQKGMSSFPEQTVIVWGGFFPYEAVYPVLQKTSDIPKFHLYALDFPTPDPYSLSAIEERTDHGMLKELKASSGARVIADEPSIELLRQYCSEHLGTPLRELDRQRYTEISSDYGEVVIRTLTCSPETNESPTARPG